MPTRHEGPTYTGDYPVLRVNLHRLPDLSAAVRREIGHNLRPQADVILSSCASAPPFAQQIPSGNSFAARRVYISCQDELDDLVREYETTGQALAMAADQVANRYGNADAMSSANARDIQDAIDAATSRLGAARDERVAAADESPLVAPRGSRAAHDRTQPAGAQLR